MRRMTKERREPFSIDLVALANAVLPPKLGLIPAVLLPSAATTGDLGTVLATQGKSAGTKKKDGEPGQEVPAR